jgi:hypothetical protein
MGIYTNGTIFGIRIYQRYDTVTDLLKIKYDALMSDEQLNDAYLCYEKIIKKENIFFQIYTVCSSTTDKGVFIAWFPISLESFLEMFSFRL